MRRGCLAGEWDVSERLEVLLLAGFGGIVRIVLFSVILLSRLVLCCGAGAEAKERNEG